MTERKSCRKNERKINQKFLEKIEAFCLFNNDFMRKCFEDSKACVELVLRIILDKPDLQVTEVRRQYQIKSLQGHFSVYNAEGHYKVEFS